MVNKLICLTFTTLIYHLLFIAQEAASQIIPDQTLPQNSLIISPDGQTILINGGTQTGGNLFHSFQEFNINTGQFVLFNNGLDVTNIFSRVTGNNISLIDGGLGANGTANLFLINPNGITFGANAQLLLGGSFIGTTASQVEFADGGKLDVSNPNQSLLTVSAPIGLNFSSNPGVIRVFGTGHNLQSDDFFITDGSNPNLPDIDGLFVFPTQSLILAGGDIELDGGVLRALGGNIELGAFKDGSVRLDTNFSLVADDSLIQSNISLQNQSTLDNSGLQPGTIKVQGNSVTLDTGSVIFNQSLNPTYMNPSLIYIKAKRLLIDGFNENETILSGIRSQSLLGDGASIAIDSRQIIFRDGAIIQSSSFSDFDAGDIEINSESLRLTGVNPISLRESTTLGSLSFLSGSSGNINIMADQITLEDGAGITSGSVSSISGDISVQAEDLEIRGFDPTTRVFSGITTSTFRGQSSNLRVEANNIAILQGGRLDSTAFGSGQGGSIDITASDSLIISDPDSSISASVESLPPIIQEQFGIDGGDLIGNSGSISINTPQLSLINQGAISVFNEGIGDGGNLAISASNLSLNNAQITAATQSGLGGNIFLSAHAEGTGTPARLSLNNAQITATAGGTGDGGNVTINNNTTFILNNSQITANAFEGDGGNIQINTGVLFIDPSSQITASSELGIDGVVNVNADFDVLNNNLNVLSLRLPSDPIEVNVNCEEIELIRSEQVSIVNQGFRFVGTMSSDSPLPPNGLVYRDGKWMTTRYVTQWELDEWGCNSYQSSVISDQLVAKSELLLAQAVTPSGEDTLPLDAIAFEGNTLFSDEILQEQIADYVGKTYPVAEYSTIIKNILDKINDLYHQEGFIFSGVRLKETTDFDGTLVFTVVEQGELKKVEIDGLRRLPESYIKNRIFAFVKTPLNVKDLNFALLQLQQDPRIETIKGDLISQNTLRLQVEEAEAFRVGIEGNNYNSFLVGENQLQLTASSLNLFGFGDTSTFQWQHTEGSDQFYIGYGVPLNGKGGELRMNYQQGNTILLVSPLDQFDIEQFQQTVGIQYYQPVIKKPSNELAFFMGLDWRQNNSSLLGQDFSFVPEIQDASTRYTALSVGQNWIHRSGNQAFLIRNELRFGVDFLDATVLDTPSGIDGRYFLWRFQGQYANRFAPNWLFRANFSGQLTPDALLFGERIQIGGIYTVPGFAYNQFSGDNGYYGQVALEYTVFNQENWGTFTLFPYFSYGFVDNNKFVSPSPDTIASAVLGLRYQRDWFYARFDYAQPLTANVRNQNILGQFGVNFRF